MLGNIFNHYVVYRPFLFIVSTLISDFRFHFNSLIGLYSTWNILCGQFNKCNMNTVYMYTGLKSQHHFFSRYSFQSQFYNNKVLKSDTYIRDFLNYFALNKIKLVKKLEGTTVQHIYIYIFICLLYLVIRRRRATTGCSAPPPPWIIQSLFRYGSSD